MKYYLFKLLAITKPPSLPDTDPNTDTVKNVLKFGFRLAGAIALLVIIISGFRYVLSRGDANNIKKSKEAIFYAIAGLVIAMSGYGIVTFIFSRIKP